MGDVLMREQPSDRSRLRNKQADGGYRTFASRRDEAEPFGENPHGSVSAARNGTPNFPSVACGKSSIQRKPDLFRRSGSSHNGEPLVHRCFILRRALASLTPPKRASPASPWLAHSEPTPYGVNLGH